MEAALACVMRSQQQLRWRQKGLEKQRTEFNTRNITLRCKYKHRTNPSQIVSKNIPEGSCLTCRRGGRLETPAGITVVPKGPFILDLLVKKFQQEVFRKQNLWSHVQSLPGSNWTLHKDLALNEILWVNPHSEYDFKLLYDSNIHFYGQLIGHWWSLLWLMRMGTANVNK